MTEHHEPQEESDEPGAPAFGLSRTVRSPRITRDDVFEAADRVLIAGGRVTIDRVRNDSGRGSPNTIHAPGVLVVSIGLAPEGYSRAGIS